VSSDEVKETRFVLSFSIVTIEVTSFAGIFGNELFLKTSLVRRVRVVVSGRGCHATVATDFIGLPDGLERAMCTDAGKLPPQDLLGDELLAKPLSAFGAFRRSLFATPSHASIVLNNRLVELVKAPQVVRHLSTVWEAALHRNIAPAGQARRWRMGRNDHESG
jgi:hypothetical protein